MIIGLRNWVCKANKSELVVAKLDGRPSEMNSIFNYFHSCHITIGVISTVIVLSPDRLELVVILCQHYRFAKAGILTFSSLYTYYFKCTCYIHCINIRNLSIVKYLNGIFIKIAEEGRNEFYRQLPVALVLLFKLLFHMPKTDYESYNISSYIEYSMKQI